MGAYYAFYRWAEGDNKVATSKYIIDAHVHIGVTEKMERSFTLEEYHRLMNTVGISSAVVMPNVSNEISESLLNDRLLTEYSQLFKEGRRGSFFPFILLSLNDMETYDQTLDPLVCGLKIHPSISRVPVGEEWEPFFYIADERGLPVIVHCGRDPMSHVSHLLKAAKAYPNVNFIGAHLGGNASELIDEAIILVRDAKLANVYLDTSAVKLPFLIEKAIRELGANKIIFGSDEPYSDLRLSKYCFDLLNISDEQRELVAHKNIEYLLGCEI
jgi:uncharacterized protein